jgi:phage tail-like protein
VPQPRINVDVDLGLPSLPGIPGLPNVPTPTRPASPAKNDGRRSTTGKGSVAPPARRPDPVGELRFTVELPHTPLGRFRECTGLAAEIEVKDYNEGGVNDFVHKLPTRMKYPNLVLKRGVTYEDALLAWLWTVQHKVLRGPDKVVHGPVKVSLMGPNGAAVRSWVFRDAYPVKWTGPNLNAGSNQIATETLEIVHTGLDPSAR